MGKFIDLTNRRVGKLVILRRIGTTLPVKWLCHCDCGKQTTVWAQNLTSKFERHRTKSCGCLRKLAIQKRTFQNLKNKRFGELLVTQFMGYIKNRSHWKCICNCGNETIVHSNKLQSGSTRSCGCLLRDRNPKIKSLLGQTFGQLTVIGRNSNIKGKLKSRWICKCSCGKIKSFLGGPLQRGTTKSCGCYTKKYLSDFFTKNLIGKKYSRLVVVKRVDKFHPSKLSLWECLCSCGNVVVKKSVALVHNRVKSCGCYKSEMDRMRLQTPNRIKMARMNSQIHGMKQRGELLI